MQCPQCQFENPAGMKFCGQCGSKLEQRCPQCGQPAAPNFKFCGECGASLTAPAAQQAAPPPAPPPPQAASPAAATPVATPPAAAPAPEGEHKQVTVLACELTGTETFSAQLGPEVTHSLLQRFFEAARSEVERYEGTISQYSSYGFLALFGAPVAHEDHARRGVLAALDLARYLREHPKELGVANDVEVQARMGLDTGSVVVGGVGDMAVGATPDAATALKGQADPGDVLVSPATARQVESLIRLEELAERGNLLRAVGLNTTYDDVALDPSSLSPFLGRERELGVLEDIRLQAADGQGQVVGIVGEAGGGKSRLLYEFRRTLKKQPMVYLLGHCLAYCSGIPYYPLLNMIRRASDIHDSDPPESVAAKLRRSLEQVGSDPEASLPYFLRLLGIREGTEALDELEPQAIQARTFHAMREMILKAGKGSLVVMELEDLHWIDESSEDFLASLVEEVGASRVLLLLTYRAGYQPRWMEKSYATQITVRRLTDAESRGVVHTILRRADLPEDLGDSILDKAGGNPFFLEELARSLVEHQHQPDAQVPDTVQDLIMARIDRLPDTHKRLLQTASVLGREFTLELLQALWDRPEEIDPILVELKSWEFLFEVTADQRLLLFKHALTQEVAYNSLLSGRRQALHKIAAHALEDLYADRLEDAYDLLVVHYPKAGEAEKAVHYMTAFAEKAASSYAHAEAARALYAAIEQVEDLPGDTRDARVIELVIRLAESLLPMARFPETLQLLEQHRSRVEQLEDSKLSAGFYFWLAHTHTYLGHQDAAQETARTAIEAAREAGDEATEGKACYVLGRDGFWAGKFAEGIENTLRAAVLLERSDEPWWQGQAYWVAGFLHYVLGDFAKALDAMERAHRIGEALDDYRLDTSWSAGYIYASLGDWETGIEKCRAGHEGAQDPLNTAAALGFLGFAYLQKKDLEQATRTLEQSVEQIEATGMQQMLGWFTSFLGRAYLLADRIDEARQQAERSLEVNREARFHYGAGFSQRILGQVAYQAGDPAEAQQQLTESRATFDRLQVPFEVGNGDLELARLALARGDLAEAHQMATDAQIFFEKLHVPAYIKLAADFLAGLDVNAAGESSAESPSEEA